MSVDFIIILISILASAFFSAMELAFLSSNRLRIEVMKKNRSLKSRIIGLFFHRESTMIASLLMGNNIALVMYGIAAARVLNPFFVNHCVGHSRISAKSVGSIESKSILRHHPCTDVDFVHSVICSYSNYFIFQLHHS